MTNNLILSLANDYARISGVGVLKMYMTVCDWSKTETEEVIEKRLKQMIRDHKTVWRLKNGDSCFIIKEDGTIIETEFIDTSYFINVRRMGNLTLTRKEAEEEVAKRMSGYYGKL